MGRIVSSCRSVRLLEGDKISDAVADGQPSALRCSLAPLATARVLDAEDHTQVSWSSVRIRF
jgi:hypothetical protein